MFETLLIYITFFFSFFKESFGIFVFSKTKCIYEEIENSQSIDFLNHTKNQIREYVGCALAFSICFIWLTFIFLFLSFFINTVIGLTLSFFSICFFVFYLNKWREFNNLHSSCLNKILSLKK